MGDLNSLTRLWSVSWHMSKTPLGPPPRSPRAAVVDLDLTLVVDATLAKVMAW